MTLFLWNVGASFSSEDDRRFLSGLKELEKTFFSLQNNKNRSKVKFELVDYHTMTLKSELGYLMFESLQALNNSG